MKEISFPVPVAECVSIADPDGRSLPGDLAIDDRRGRLYLVDEGLRRLLVYDTALALEAMWPPPAAGYAFRGPLLAVGVGPGGEPIYVSEGADLWVLSLDGSALDKISLPRVTGVARPLVMANDVTTTPDGAIWITDSWSKQIVSLSPDGKLLQAIDASDRMGTLGAILSSARGTLLVADPMHARVFELQPDPDQPGTQRFTDRWYGGRGLGWLQLGDRDDAGLVSVDALAEVRSLLLAADETLLRYFLPLDRREAWDPDWLKFLLPSADRRILNDQRLIMFEEGCRAHYSGICAGPAFDRSTDTVYYARRARPGLCRLPAPDGRKDGAR